MTFLPINVACVIEENCGKPTSTDVGVTPQSKCVVMHHDGPRSIHRRRKRNLISTILERASFTATRILRKPEDSELS
jgi:hypothetical protein